MPHVPPGGLILVTGANGYVAGVTIQQFLDAGYRVRGTVRNASKYEWISSHYGSNFELIEVPDLAVPGALDEAVKGVDGVAHMATSIQFIPDPQLIIPQGIASALGVLESAAKEPSVKSVVLTSSSKACRNAAPGQEYKITSSSYNEASKVAWTAPITPDLPRGVLNYACLKTESEQQSFKWVEEHKPHFTFNTVLPDTIWGRLACPEKTGFISSLGILKSVWDGGIEIALNFPSAWYADTEDTGLLHIAALTQPDVQGERLFAFGGRYSYKEILAILRKQHPEKKFPNDFEEVLDNGTVENGRAEELLKRLGKKNGFSSLEEVVSKFVSIVVKAEKEGWLVGPNAPQTHADKMKEDGMVQET